MVNSLPPLRMSSNQRLSRCVGQDELLCASNDPREVGLKSARLGYRLVATLESIRIA
jgi:hypothetical protein